MGINRSGKPGPNRITVVTAADRRYAVALAVMGRSLIDNLSPRWKLDLHVLDGGLPVRDRRKVLGSWDPSRVAVRWIRPRARDLRGLPRLPWYGDAIYFRFLAPKLLPPRVRRAIYLDADVLVLDDLSRLWRTGLRGRAFGAVQDTGFITIDQAYFPWRQMGISPTEKYLNSGVLLMDLPRWRKERVSERALAYLEAPGHEVAFPDQDALNALFAGKWRPLDPRWNVVLDSAYHCLQKLPLDDRKPLARAVAKPGILHFAAGPKPWEKRCPHKRLFLYYVYLDRTRWRSWRPD
jgi:lipopolysaccharide biosynthesis glycosyltransferase